MDASLVAWCREQFPALRRIVSGQPAIYLDGPAGTQTPQRVIDAVSHYLAHTNANHGGAFATSQESDAVLDNAHQAFADLVGSRDPAEVYFGANMTSLTFALSRALARQWSPGDEIVVTRLDHDANASPWILAAQDAGAEVKMANIRPDDCTLDVDHLLSLLTPRTRLVALGCASNATGGINPVERIVHQAKTYGALTFLDAVHYAPHALMDVTRWGCDFVGFSAYKFFGPHVGAIWGRRELLESINAYKVRPATDELPGKWMSGTQNHEGIAGAAEAVEYLADLGRKASQQPQASRRDALVAAMTAIGEHESQLASSFLAGLADRSEYRVWGPPTTQGRLPTFSITHSSKSPQALAEHLADQGVFTWHGNYYALNLSEALGREPEGMLRIGFVHYNTPQEVERTLELLP